MPKLIPSLVPLLAIHAAVAQGPKAPPISAYLLPRDIEMALARSAAPAGVTEHATFKVLTATGFQVVREGDNGFVCLVMRGWSAPTYTPARMREMVYDSAIRAPICFDPAASRTVLPFYELRTRLGVAGKSPDQIAEAVQAAYARAELPARTGVGFAYMWSADQQLGPEGHWHPHMMIYAPFYDNAMLGNNAPPLPFVGEDAGTPFAVVVIALDDRLAIKATPR